MITETFGFCPRSLSCSEDEDEDEDKDKDEDEIPNYALLLTALVKRVGVSRMRDFFMDIFIFRKQKTEKNE